MFSTILYRKENKVAVVSINRPEALNALNAEVISELEQLVTILEIDKEVGALIITGEGRAFVAGADIKAQMNLDVEGGRNWGKRGSALFRRIELLEIPTVAAVNGYALGGGCELAMSCDMILASKKAKFGQPEVGLGIPPGFSGTQRLPKRVGMAKAKELILTGEHIGAEEAERIGLVNKVTEPEKLMDEAIKLAGKITENAPLAVKYANIAMKRGAEVDIDTGIAIENELFARCFTTEEQVKRMDAFVNKK